MSTLKKDKNVSKTVDVDKGSVNASVTKQDQQDFKFKSPTLVASVRGTSLLFGVGVDSTNIDLENGRLFVKLSLANKSPVILTNKKQCL
ncbi:MAG: FecR domain-containing protein [Ignavibacteriales bacterium]|nr:FecR domain-containing protein [Ignavibacteriales bacterium]